MSIHVLPAVMAMAWLSLVSAQPAPAPASPAPVKPPIGGEQVEPTRAEDRDTIAAGMGWLTMLDSGKIGPAWDIASEQLKKAVTRQKWVTEITAMRKPYGALDKRTPERFARAHSMPNAPDGDYSIIEYEARFTNGKRALEQVIWTLEPGEVWRVAGYFIR